jgi:hypothetical protein
VTWGTCDYFWEGAWVSIQWRLGKTIRFDTKAPSDDWALMRAHDRRPLPSHCLLPLPLQLAHRCRAILRVLGAGQGQRWCHAPALSHLTAVSPVDGRYGPSAPELRGLLSEHALIRGRVLVEVKWLEHLSDLEVGVRGRGEAAGAPCMARG